MRITNALGVMIGLAATVAMAVAPAAAQSAGSADLSYGPDGTGRYEHGIPGRYFEGADVAVDAAGRAVVGGFGEVDPGNGTWITEAMVLRFTTGGVLDVSFDSDGIQTFGIPPMATALGEAAVEIAADGGIWFGYTRAYCETFCPPDPEQANFMIYKLSASGGIEDSLSIAFDYGSATERKDDVLADMVELPDGRLAVVGTAERDDSNDTDIVIAMVEQPTPGGVLRLDTSWGGGGTSLCWFDLGGTAGKQDTGAAVAVEPGGTILVGGTAFVGDGVGFDGTDFGLCRFNSSGGLQEKWHSASGGIVLDSREALGDLLVLADGSILAAGEIAGTGGTDFGVVRLDSNLVVDTSYGPHGTGWSSVNFQYPFVGDTEDGAESMLLDADGGLVLAGEISGGGLTSALALAKLTPAGAIDNSWGIGGGGRAVHSFHTDLEDTVGGIARQADGKYLAAGMTMDTTPSLYVLRMHGPSSPELPFSDGFESGGLTAWSSSVR